MDDRLRIALLIDADNASTASLEYVLDEIANLGVANVRRAYGDWGSPHLRGWREALLANAIQPMQQIAYTSKGNASDMAMVIDAMDLLHSGRFDAFALMSSDSDFTPLAMHLRARGMQVYGFGRAKTPTAFKSACTTFFHVDTSEEDSTSASSTQPQLTSVIAPEATTALPIPPPAMPPAALPAVALAEPPKKRTSAELRHDTSLVNLLRSATEAAKGEDGWSNLSAIGNHIANRGSFTPKNYGYKTLKPLIVATELFTLHADGKHIKALPSKKAKKKSI
jgi:uncharacterized LabA/DUF88 family protein